MLENNCKLEQEVVIWRLYTNKMPALWNKQHRYVKIL
jgi:hypothetical protein